MNTHEIPLVHHVDEKNDSYAGIEEKDDSIDVSACATATLGFAHLDNDSTRVLPAPPISFLCPQNPPTTAIVHCDVASNLTWLNGGHGPPQSMNSAVLVTVGH